MQELWNNTVKIIKLVNELQMKLGITPDRNYKCMKYCQDSYDKAITFEVMYVLLPINFAS